MGRERELLPFLKSDLQVFKMQLREVSEALVQSLAEAQRLWAGWGWQPCAEGGPQGGHSPPGGHVIWAVEGAGGQLCYLAFLFQNIQGTK